MLFLSKKTMVSVLALGTLLSIAPRMHAEGGSSISGREAAAVAAGLATGYLIRFHDVNNANKHAALQLLDLPARWVQNTFNFVTDPKTLTAAVGIATAYALVKHGSNVTNTNAVQSALNLVKVAPR